MREHILNKGGNTSFRPFRMEALFLLMEEKNDRGKKFSKGLPGRWKRI